MKISQIDNYNKFLLKLSLSEVEILHKILQKPLEVISDSEFRVRLGFSKSDVNILISNIENYKKFKNNQDVNEIEIEFSFDNLLILRRSIVEICYGFHIPDFENVIGANEECIINYLSCIKQAMD